MRILLDTNVLLWTLMNSPRIGKIRDLILSADTGIYVSAASFREIAIKNDIGKRDADVKTIRAAVEESGFHELAILGIHSETLSTLPLLHRDPFDRMIVAQAMTEPMKLLTGDGVLGAYSSLVQTI
jgi:PIN domain nuclease of toxin-antitoxin system